MSLGRLTRTPVCHRGAGRRRNFVIVVVVVVETANCKNDKLLRDALVAIAMHNKAAERQTKLARLYLWLANNVFACSLAHDTAASNSDGLPATIKWPH